MGDLKWLLSGDGVSTIGVLLTAVVVTWFALWREWIVTGGRFRELVTEHDETQARLDTVSDELNETRVAHAGTVVRLELLEHEHRKMDAELAALRRWQGTD